MTLKYIIGVTGTPGAGKSTFCKGLQKFLSEINRPVKVCNVDPGCDISLAYKPDWNILDYTNVRDVMKTLELGPNGALMEAMTSFFTNYHQELITEIQKYDPGTTVILDMPGQVELFTIRDPIKNFYERLQDAKFSVCNLYMFEATILLTPDLFVGYSTNATMTMCHMGLPAVNLLSKVDILYNAKEQKHKLDFPFEYYASPDFSTLCTKLTQDTSSFPIDPKFRKLTNLLGEVNESYGLLNYLPFTAADQRFFAFVLFQLDRCLGYINPNHSVKEAQQFRLIASTTQSEREILDYVETFMERCVKRKSRTKE